MHDAPLSTYMEKTMLIVIIGVFIFSATYGVGELLDRLKIRRDRAKLKEKVYAVFAEGETQ